MSSAFDTIASIAVPAIGTAIAGPIGGAVASGLYSGIKSGDPLKGLAAAGGSYLGSSIGSGLTSSTVGTGLGLGGGVLSALPENILNTNLGGAVGGFLGGGLAESLVGSDSGKISKTNVPQVAQIASPAPILKNPETGYKPTRMPQVSSGSLADSLSGLSPIQQVSGLATEGYYGSGLGKDEQNYWLNMVNRRLVDDSGTVDPDLQELLPIEQSYLSQLGIQGRPVDILQGIEKYLSNMG